MFIESTELLFPVCLSNMRFDIVKKIMTLIYAGSVKVLESEMDRFVAATKYLKLKGFGNVNENMGDADSENDQNSEHNYTIRLDRIDAKQCATTSKNKSTGKRPSTSNVFPSSRLQNIDLNQEKFFPSDSDDSDGLNEPSSESDGKYNFKNNNNLLDIGRLISKYWLNAVFLFTDVIIDWTIAKLEQRSTQIFNEMSNSGR